MQTILGLEKLDLGEELKFSGYPIEIYHENQDYYIKCKEVYVGYTSFRLWKHIDKRRNEIGHNKEGTSCKIREINGTTRIGCLMDSTEEFNKLEKTINKIILCHKKQKQ